MKISKEKNRTILSLTPREVEELEDMVFYADRSWEEHPTPIYDAVQMKEDKAFVAVLQRWCKAFGIESKAYLYKSKT